MSKIDESLDRIESLSPAPQVLPRLLTALAEADTDLSEVVELIAVDPAFTAKLLQVCNSVYLGSATPVNEVHEAVHRLGFDTVYQVIASVSAAQFLKPAELGGLDPGQLWRHSVTSAFAAQLMADKIGAEAGLLFTAGLLHDIGKAILDEAYKADYAVLLADKRNIRRRLVEQESGRCGVDHAEVGGRLLERWKFSSQMVASVRFHHHPAAAGAVGSLAAAVDLADALAHSLASAEPERELARLEPDAALKILGWAPEQLLHCMDRLREHLALIHTMAQLSL